VLISASAIGYYGYDRGEEALTEDTKRGDGFSPTVADWEDATPGRAGGRGWCGRTGIVQSPRRDTSAVPAAVLAGLGGRLGSGQQWLSWIGIDDLVDVYHRGCGTPTCPGRYALLPEPARNVDYTRQLAHVLHRPGCCGTPFGPRFYSAAGCAGTRVRQSTGARRGCSRLITIPRP